MTNYGTLHDSAKLQFMVSKCRESKLSDWVVNEIVDDDDVIRVLSFRQDLMIGVFYDRIRKRLSVAYGSRLGIDLANLSCESSFKYLIYLDRVFAARNMEDESLEDSLLDDCDKIYDHFDENELNTVNEFSSLLSKL